MTKRPPRRPRHHGTSWESTLLLHLRAAGIPAPEREFLGVPGRKFRFDFAWPQIKVAAEVEGGIFLGRHGRHTSPAGYSRDCEKYSLAAIHGWCVIRVTPGQVRDGSALALIRQALDSRRAA